MADKIDVRLILELRQANMSQRAIAASRHISTKSVAAVWRRADALGVSFTDVADKSEDEVYLLFFFQTNSRRRRCMHLSTMSMSMRN